MTNPNPTSLGRIAAVDYGTVRIGIAISDPQQTIASPLENYTRRNPQLDAKHFEQLAREERVALWVIGLPIHCDGRESHKSIEARRFGQWLAESTGVPVSFFDERFSSSEADQLLNQAEFTKRRRKKRLDMVAAQIILTSYLESPSRGEQPPTSLED